MKPEDNEKGLKDANDVLRNNSDNILEYINQARTIPDKNIVKYEDIKDLV